MVLALALLALAPQASDEQAAIAKAGDSVSEIVVTAQKRRERLIDVPISAMALSGAQLEKQNVKSIEDIVRLAPGVSLLGGGDSSDSDISIRGIVSSVGAPTVGVYIDDVPVQVRMDAGVWVNPYPKIFDIDRVELLRGPQGTLFGAGAEGGAIRFITPEAPLNKTSGFVRGGLDTVAGGGAGWEAGAAFGGPIVPDRLGFRASLWRQKLGGYADRVDPATGATLAKNVNGETNTVAHLSLKAAPFANLVITPSLFFQDSRKGDTGLYWEREDGDYKIATRVPSPRHDRMVTASLGVEYDFGWAKLKSISAYTHRLVSSRYDSTQYYFASYSPGIVTLPDDPGFAMAAHYDSSLQNYSQELRLTSNTGRDDRISWVAGLFFLRQREGYDGRYAANVDEYANYLSEAAGTGPSDGATYFGEGPIDGQYAYVRHYVDNTQDMAVFADATLRLSARLRVSAGVRQARNRFAYHDFQDGHWGPGAPTYKTGKQQESPLTPRLNLSYDLGQDRMAYVSVSKGYRIGGVNQPVPANACAADLASVGMTTAPLTYNSDTVWSYETGLKGRFFARKLQLAMSAFYVDWNGIQQSVSLSTCGYSFIANLGKAVSRGADAQWSWRAGPRLTLSGAFGLTDAYNTQNITAANALLAKKGDPLAVPKWTANLGAQYDFSVFNGADGFVRFDYDYASAYHDRALAVYGADPLTNDTSASHYVSARLGLSKGAWNASLYADNLLNSHKVSSRYRDSTATTPLALRDVRPKPLSIGVTIERKY